MTHSRRNSYCYSNIYPDGLDSTSLIGVKETMEEARELERPYKEKGVRTYVDHAGLRTERGVVGAFAVYAHPDDIGYVLGIS